MRRRRSRVPALHVVSSAVAMTCILLDCEVGETAEQHIRFGDGKSNAGGEGLRLETAHLNSDPSPI